MEMLWLAQEGVIRNVSRLFVTSCIGPGHGVELITAHAFQKASC